MSKRAFFVPLELFRVSPSFGAVSAVGLRCFAYLRVSSSSSCLRLWALKILHHAYGSSRSFAGRSVAVKLMRNYDDHHLLGCRSKWCGGDADAWLEGVRRSLTEHLNLASSNLLRPVPFFQWDSNRFPAPLVDPIQRQRDREINLLTPIMKV